MTGTSGDYRGGEIDSQQIQSFDHSEVMDEMKPLMTKVEGNTVYLTSENKKQLEEQQKFKDLINERLNLLKQEEKKRVSI